MRFFTPKCEVPFVGHATLAAHYVRASLSGPSPKPLRQLSGTGLIGIDAQETPAGIEIGMRLRVDFNTIDDELTLPVWRPVAGSAQTEEDAR